MIKNVVAGKTVILKSNESTPRRFKSIFAQSREIQYLHCYKTFRRFHLLFQYSAFFPLVAMRILKLNQAYLLSYFLVPFRFDEGALVSISKGCS